AVRQSNQLKQWLIFFLHGIRETAENSIQVFKDTLTLKERLEREVLPRFSTRRQKNAQVLMQYLYQVPVLDIKKASSLLSLKPNTAATLVNDFVKYGILYELTGKQRNRMYLFKDYFMIFKQQDQ
ncbi:hypothetical protein MNBD_GAMMA07-901, partial [hydrothermal vent metagenome]